MSLKTFIEIYKIDTELCDKIIGLYDKNVHLAQPGRLGENPRIDKSMKDSMDLCVPIELYGSFEPFFELLKTHVGEYIEKYYIGAGATGMGPVGYSKFSSLQKYPAGGGYPAIHCERDSIQYAHRALVWMVYLTDTPNGGTEFPHQELTTECVKGDLIIWPSDMTHLHRGVVSETHEKMIFTGWIDFIQPDALQSNSR
ncbi:MAG: 2OG-Fe(II) oxygenase [Gammaproteobacteria bacterium]|nr:2OG-Fe(II) oxygenase [Gammaproteobacteria bacterium]